MNVSIQQKVRQYLVHSFLYYRLDESIISDRHYEKINLYDDASGFSVRKYPAEIISTAMHLLYQRSYIKSMTFDTYLARFGYSLN